MNKMSDFDSLQFLLQLSHMDLFLFDPVQDLLLRPRYLFLDTQVNTRHSRSDWLNTSSHEKETLIETCSSSSTCLLSLSVWTDTVL